MVVEAKIVLNVNVDELGISPSFMPESRIRALISEHLDSLLRDGFSSVNPTLYQINILKSELKSNLKDNSGNNSETD